MVLSDFLRTTFHFITELIFYPNHLETGLMDCVFLQFLAIVFVCLLIVWITRRLLAHQEPRAHEFSDVMYVGLPIHANKNSPDQFDETSEWF